MSEIERAPDGKWVGSGNPGGFSAAVRSERQALAALARTYSELAIHQLVLIAANGLNETARVKACEILLDRAHGKPAVAPPDPSEFEPRVIRFRMSETEELLELEAGEVKDDEPAA